MSFNHLAIEQDDAPTIQFQEDQTFKLRAPKGKLKHSKIYSAYTKTKLSSIPRSVEIILLDAESKSEKIKNFEQRIRRQNAINNSARKSASSNSINSTIHSNLGRSRSMYSMLPMKGCCGVFASKKERFEKYEEFISKYSPGPGEYQNSNRCIDNTNQQGNFRYQSLFAQPSSCSLKKVASDKNNVDTNGVDTDITPGPGAYNPIYNFGKVGFKFPSKGKRFKEREVENIGPGSYFDSSKDIYDYNKPKQQQKPSSFFYIEKPAEIPKLRDEENKLKKYISIQKEKEYEVPGPGQYNFIRMFDVDEKKKGSNKGTNGIKCGNLIPEDLRKKCKEMNIYEQINGSLPGVKSLYEKQSLGNQNNKNLNNTHRTMDFWKAVKPSKHVRSPFLSKSKKIGIYDEIERKHNPGPCYYQSEYDQNYDIF